MEGTISLNESDAFLDTGAIQHWEQILAALLVSLISAIGLIGNLMIIAAVAFSCKLQTSTNAFVTSLAVADLLTSFSLLFYVVGLLGDRQWPLPNAQWICNVTAFTIYACRGTSVYTLSALALNRLILITRRFLYTKIYTSWKLVVLVLVPWIISWGSLIALTTARVGAFGYDLPTLSCSIVHLQENDNAFFISAVLIIFPIPLFLIFTSYFLIYTYLKRYFKTKKKILAKSVNTDILKLWKLNCDTESVEHTASTSEVKIEELSRRAKVEQSFRQRRKISQKQIEITKNLFLVVCSVFLCFVPFFIVVFVQGAYHALFYTRLITLANSAMNFAINAHKHPDFRLVLRHMMMFSYGDIPRPSRLLRFLLSKIK